MDTVQCREQGPLWGCFLSLGISLPRLIVAQVNERLSVVRRVVDKRCEMVGLCGGVEPMLGLWLGGGRTGWRAPVAETVFCLCRLSDNASNDACAVLTSR